MPDLHLIELHSQRVLEAFRRGEFDQIEIIGQTDEKEFSELCFREMMLEALAQAMPTARPKAGSSGPVARRYGRVARATQES